MANQGSERYEKTAIKGQLNKICPSGLQSMKRTTCNQRMAMNTTITQLWWLRMAASLGTGNILAHVLPFFLKRWIYLLLRFEKMKLRVCQDIMKLQKSHNMCTRKVLRTQLGSDTSWTPGYVLVYMYTGHGSDFFYTLIVNGYLQTWSENLYV